MNQEQVDGLIAYLHSLGFDGEAVRQDIRSHNERGDSEFTAAQEAKFENETVRFELHFRKEQQVHAYLFDRFTAVYKDLKEVSGNGEVRRSFSSGPDGICNANLAYYIVSGTLDSLQRQINSYGLEWFPGTDVYRTIEKNLMKNASSFEIKTETAERDGYLHCNLAVERSEGKYHAKNLHISLTPYPGIPDKAPYGFKIADLEGKMAAVDWTNDDHIRIINKENDLEFLPDVQDILNRMEHLRRTVEGTRVADLLELRYFLRSPLMENCIRDSAWELLAELPRRTWAVGEDQTVREAYNLLAGRAVWIPKDREPVGAGDWQLIKFEAGDDKMQHAVETIPGYKDGELYRLIDMVPINESEELDVIATQLGNGDIVSVPLKNGKMIQIEAAPAQHTLLFYDLSMRPIEVNLGFDSNWKSDSPKVSQKTIPGLKEKPPTKYKINKPHKKGKGL